MKTVVVYPKDTEKWKQFTTDFIVIFADCLLLCIPKILKNESNSQHGDGNVKKEVGCCVSQRYWKMKAIHNKKELFFQFVQVVVYPKDTEKWKQFTTTVRLNSSNFKLLCIPKILKNESNSQHLFFADNRREGCCVSQRYWKMKAIHNAYHQLFNSAFVVVYPKDTEKWKQFTTESMLI